MASQQGGLKRGGKKTPGEENLEKINQLLSTLKKEDPAAAVGGGEGLSSSGASSSSPCVSEREVAASYQVIARMVDDNTRLRGQVNKGQRLRDKQQETIEGLEKRLVELKKSEGKLRQGFDYLKDAYQMIIDLRLACGEGNAEGINELVKELEGGEVNWRAFHGKMARLVGIIKGVLRGIKGNAVVEVNGKTNEENVGFELSEPVVVDVIKGNKGVLGEMGEGEEEKVHCVDLEKRRMGYFCKCRLGFRTERLLMEHLKDFGKERKEREEKGGDKPKRKYRKKGKEGKKKEKTAKRGDQEETQVFGVKRKKKGDEESKQKKKSFRGDSDKAVIENGSELVIELEGEVHLESEQGKGATITAPPAAALAAEDGVSADDEFQPKITSVTGYSGGPASKNRLSSSLSAAASSSDPLAESEEPQSSSIFTGDASTFADELITMGSSPAHAVDNSRLHLGAYCICGQLCANRSALHHHLWYRRNRFECTVCKRYFPGMSYLNKHMYGAHKLIVPSEDNPMASTSSTLAPTFSGAAGQPGKPRYLERNLLDEPRHGYVEVVDLEELDSQGQRLPGSRKLYHCRCGKVFSMETTLKMHISTRENWNGREKLVEFKCERCTKRFGSHGGLKKHWAREHKEFVYKKKFGCRQCGATFTTQTQLFYHSRIVHRQQRQENGM